ncbi:hypothetical protein H4R33_000128 [Dimargaris cristalligena]|nr:hypothetical protein H4R33_000128 [Dimargaris cristalligena]
MATTRLKLRSYAAAFLNAVFFDLHLYLILGVVLGVIASFIDISYEWLNDYREGYCQTGFYLNQRFCCWAEKSYATCAGWVSWSKYLGIQSPVASWLYHYLVYILSGVLLAGASSVLVVYFAPYASSSGISEIKTILGGYKIPRFLGFRTLVIKIIGTVLAVASGLGVGKEGSLVHIAGCCGNILSRLFGRFRNNEAKRQEMLSVASAAGISVAFGAPIGGVLFSLEELSYYFPSQTMWRSFFCAMVASMMLKFMNPFRTGKLVAFQVTYDRAWHGFELVFFIILGALGGIIGTAIIRLNLWAATRRQLAWVRANPVTEVLCLAAVTSAINFLNILLQVDTVELVSNLFTECADMGYEGICDPSRIGRTVLLLIAAAILKTLFASVTYGTKVPGGILMPSMAIGACTGRAIGILVQLWQRHYPTLVIFRSCAPDVPCVTPGVYALVGAAATMAGVTRMTITTVVVMFELTGALIYVLPIMVAVTVSKWVGDGFGPDGIFERLIRFHGYPYLGPQVRYPRETAAAEVMTRVQDLVVIATATAPTNTLAGLREFLIRTGYQGFPVVQSLETMQLVGYVSRPKLQAAVEQALKVDGYSEDTVAYFGTSLTMDHPVTTRFVDLRAALDTPPITMSLTTPMFLVIETFKQLGLRYILITRNGQLNGLITKKDVLRHLAALDNRSERYQSIPGTYHYDPVYPGQSSPSNEYGDRPSAHFTHRFPPVPQQRFASLTEDEIVS